MKEPQRSRSGWLPWALFVAAAAMIIAALFIVLSRGALADRGSDLGFGIVSLSFPLVGAFIAASRPDNAIGWLLLGIGIMGGGISLSDELVMNANATGNGAEAAPYLAWMSETVGNALTPMLIALVFLVFPTGRLPSRGWRWVVGLAVAAATLRMLSAGLIPGRYESSGLANPWGLEGMGELLGAVRGVADVLLLAYMLLAVASLFVRRRRAGLVERQQLKWLALAAAVMVLVMGLAAVMEAAGVAGEGRGSDWAALAFFGTALAAVAGAIGVAVLRYRLLDIDLVINRTVVYVLLTGLLVGLYAGGVTIFQAALAPIAGGGELAVATTTLAVAALFAPLRRRVQSFIDHHFYRRKYDAQKTIEGFSWQLRDEVDLAAISDQLVAVVQVTMQPAHVGLWSKETIE